MNWFNSRPSVTLAVAGFCFFGAAALAEEAMPQAAGVEIARAAAEKCGDTPDEGTLAGMVAKGREVSLAGEMYDKGFGDSESVMRMTLRNRHGETSERELRQRTLENEALDVGDKSLIVFDRPRDVAGTTMLTFAKILEPDDQWMFMPALKRVKRISSANKSGPFMGSEFAFEDFSSQEYGKYTYRYLRSEACPGAEELTCDVIERYPLYENSGYVKQIGWTDQAAYRGYMTEFYNRRCDKLKTLTITDHRQYLDHYWRAHALHMVNHLTGKSTDLFWEGFEFRVGLKASDFTRNSLQRAK